MWSNCEQRHTEQRHKFRHQKQGNREESGKKRSLDWNTGNRSVNGILLLLREGSFDFISPTTKNQTLSFQNEPCWCRAPRHTSRIESWQITLIVHLLSKLLQIRLSKNFCLPFILSASKKPSAICWGKTALPWIQSPTTLATPTTQAGRGDLTDTGKSFHEGLFLFLLLFCLSVVKWQVLKTLHCDMQQVTAYCLPSVCLSFIIRSLSLFSFCPPFHFPFLV